MQKAFDAEDWIDRLATSLPLLAKAQESYLEHYWRHYPRTLRIVDGRDVTPFPLDDVRMVYSMVRYSRRLGEEAQYASLRKLLDPVRHSLLAHPTLQRVAVTGRLIGDNDFWMTHCRFRLVDLCWRPDCGPDGAGYRAFRRPLPDSGAGAERVPVAGQ